MIKPIPGLPVNVLGFAAKGTVTARDYESGIILAAETRFSRHAKGRFLHHLGENFSGFEAGVIWRTRPRCRVSRLPCWMHRAIWQEQH